jgi:hypothetical protein
MGRTEAFHSVRWDDDLKLGEHEDFFLRFRGANQNVYSCQYINVHHHKNQWWEKVNDPYYKRRKHVFKYFEKMLKKYYLKKLVTFDSVLVHLD